MIVLRSLCPWNQRGMLLSYLKSFSSCQQHPSLSYSTEPTGPTETTETPETTKDHTGRKDLPGRPSVYEPDYLRLLKPKFHPHGLVNIKMSGYDFVVLEKLQKIVHKYLGYLDIEVVEGYAKRAESFKVTRLAPNSSKSIAEYQLKEYQRVLRISEVPSTKMGLIIEVLQAVTPPGVKCTVALHTEEEQKSRYIPDLEMKALQQQLEELGGPSKIALLQQKAAEFRKK